MSKILIDEATVKLVLGALELAQDNLRDHGDNCFLHDEGEYNSCFCGKDSLSDHLQSVVEKLDESLAKQPVAEDSSVAQAAKQPAQQEPVTDEENEKFSRDVSNFKGADPEATKHALEEFLRNRVPAIGDIRALKHRIHALEGDVIGYKQMLKAAEQQARQEPVAVGSLDSLKLSMQHSAWDGVIQLSDALKNIDDFAKEQPAQQEPVPEAMARYLQVCSSGGMPSELRKSVQSLVSDAERLGYFKAAPQPVREPLTDEQIKKLAAPLFMTHYWKLCNEFARAIEAAHGIKENT